MSLANLARGHQVQSRCGTILQSGNKVLEVIAVLPVDALSVHDLQLVAQLAVVGLTEEGEAQVAPVLNAQQGIAAATGQVRHALAVDIDGFHGGGGEGVLERQTVLELSHPDGEGLVPCDTVVGVEFLYDAREVVHEEERPAVGDLGVCPEEYTLQFEGVGVDVILPGVVVAALCIAVKLDAAAEFLDPFLVQDRRGV